MLNRQQASRPPLIESIGRLKEEGLDKLYKFCIAKKPIMEPTISSYASGRKELWIKRRCDLRKNFTISSGYLDPYIKDLGNKVLPNFDIGLLLYYPPNCNIKLHRDHTIFNQLAVCINLNEVIFNLHETRSPTSNLMRMRAKKGEIFVFNCKVLHGTERLDKERWSIIFWYLKDQYK